MHSFPAGSANSHYTTRIHPALASFANEVCGTLARLCAYLMALALIAVCGIALWNHLPDVTATETSPRTWSQAGRTAPAFAVNHFIFQGKTEAYEIFRHPEGGRKDVFHWSGAGGMPVAELEIYRPGGEIDQAGSAAGYLAARMDPAGVRELEAAGIVDSKFGAVHSVSPGRRHGASLPPVFQARRRAQIPYLRLVMPGRGFAGPPYRNRLHAEPAGSADGRQRYKTGGIVRPCRGQAQRLRDIWRARPGSGLGYGRRQPAAARRPVSRRWRGLFPPPLTIVATSGQDTCFHETFSLGTALFRCLWRN